MRITRTKRTVVEHVVETDAFGNQRIGARRVVDAGDPPTPEGVDESAPQTDERARLSGR